MMVLCTPYVSVYFIAPKRFNVFASKKLLYSIIVDGGNNLCHILINHFFFFFFWWGCASCVCFCCLVFQREKARRTMGKEAAKTKEEMQAIQRKNEIARIRKVGGISLFSLYSGCL